MRHVTDATVRYACRNERHELNRTGRPVGRCTHRYVECVDVVGMVPGSVADFVTYHFEIEEWLGPSPYS